MYAEAFAPQKTRRIASGTLALQSDVGLERKRPACNERESAKKRLQGNRVDCKSRLYAAGKRGVASGTLALQSVLEYF